MSTPDFSKIFGSNATSSQNWADNNYLTGWGVLGDVPPPYQLFDYLQKTTDTKLKWLFEQSQNKFRLNSTEYEVGDIAYSASLPSWSYLECTVAGTTAATEPTWGTVTAGQEIVDGTVTWRIRDIKSASGVPLGTVMPHLVTTPPPGWLALDTGALISRTTYAELWAWVQANAPLISEADWQTQAASQSSVGAYSTGDGSTTFRLPKILDYVRGGTVEDVGEWQGDAIRNITGSGGVYAYYATNGTIGAITTAVGNDRSASSSNGAGHGTISFDASKVVPTADENRPKTVKMLYCVKAFDAITDQGLIDITALANEVANKQQTISYIQIQDEKASGTAGGTFTSGAWRTRILNTINHDDTSHATVSNNQITLPAGVYEVDVSVPAAFVNHHKARLQNVSNNETALLGTSERSDIYQGVTTITKSIIRGKIVVISSDVFEVQHYCETTYTNNGFGLAAGISGVNEIYTIATFKKVG